MSECTDMRELRKEWTKFRQYAEGVVSVNVELKQERDGLREQLKGWKKVAQDAEKVRDLALTNQEVAILGRVRAERALDSMRSEAAMRQREHAAILADANEARHKAEQERDGLHLCGESVARMAAELKVERHQANERAANLAVELAAMTLSRDQERQERNEIEGEYTQLAELFWVESVCTHEELLARAVAALNELAAAKQDADLLRRQVEVLVMKVAPSILCPTNDGCPVAGGGPARPWECKKCWSAWAAKQAKEGGK
jgi:hypothetical protein